MVKKHHKIIQTELIQSVNHLKLTIPRMKNLEIPINPRNYSVWYEYSRGTTLELNQAIDDLLNSGTEFTHSVNQELYTKYIENKAADVMEAVQVETQKLLVNLMNDLKNIQISGQKFSGVLEENQAILHSNPDVSAIKQLVKTLMEEANRVKNTNAELEGRLLVLSGEIDAMRNEMSALNEVAYTDQLTGILNRRALDESLANLFSDYHQNNMVFTVLILDIDFFKKFNDTFGHVIGDRVLIFVAQMLQDGVEKEDIVARYGGEEFVIALRDTRYKEAMTIADQLREKIQKKNLKVGENNKLLGNITISIGVAEVTMKDHAESLIVRADKALYKAKEQGRNCVVGDKNET